MPKIKPVQIPQRTQKYWTELNKIIDPELNLGIVDLGLVYEVRINKKGLCKVYMTLTSPTCPVAPMLIQQTTDKMRGYPGVKDVETEIVWEPLWHDGMINPELRDMLFGI